MTVLPDIGTWVRYRGTYFRCYLNRVGCVRGYWDLFNNRAVEVQFDGAEYRLCLLRELELATPEEAVVGALAF